MSTSAKCSFCGGIHGDECPEFPTLPAVPVIPDAKHLADYANKPRVWTCKCKATITATVGEAADQDWLLHEKNGVIWADCPLCSLSDRQAMSADIADWKRKGRPRGDN